MLLGAHPQEGEVICWVKVSHHTARFVREAADEAGVLDGGGVVQCALDGNSWKHTRIIKLLNSMTKVWRRVKKNYGDKYTDGPVVSAKPHMHSSVLLNPLGMQKIIGCVGPDAIK